MSNEMLRLLVGKERRLKALVEDIDKVNDVVETRDVVVELAGSLRLFAARELAAVSEYLDAKRVRR